jgi:hypothetical protein
LSRREGSAGYSLFREIMALQMADEIRKPATL